MHAEPRLRRHVLYSRSAEAASQGAFAAINGMQDIEHPADQLIGLACAFKYTADACGHDPIDLIVLVERMEADCRFREANTLSAVAKYADNEIAGKLQ
ncbi:hypothetical protein [Lysobacter sp. Hz 25]|uniref:hypothetical protein n=1 Tax=Lysobacter sp. Hz 25 TaxID=3383698 RepID=UPI0038D4429B